MTKKSDKQEKTSTRRARRTLDAAKIEQWSLKLYETEDAEMVVLRGHMFLESQAYEFLAARLGSPAEALPNTTFGVLSQIALSGDECAGLLRVISEFNRIRNDLAHNMDYNVLTSDLEQFVAEAAEFIPADIQPSTDLLLKVKSVLGSVFLDLAERKVKIATEREDLAKLTGDRIQAAIASLRIDFTALAELEAKGVDINEMLIEDLPRLPRAK